VFSCWLRLRLQRGKRSPYPVPLHHVAPAHGRVLEQNIIPKLIFRDRESGGHLDAPEVQSVGRSSSRMKLALDGEGGQDSGNRWPCHGLEPGARGHRFAPASLFPQNIPRNGRVFEWTGFVRPARALLDLMASSMARLPARPTMVKWANLLDAPCPGRGAIELDLAEAFGQGVGPLQRAFQCVDMLFDAWSTTGLYRRRSPSHMFPAVCCCEVAGRASPPGHRVSEATSPARMPELTGRTSWRRWSVIAACIGCQWIR